MGFVLWIAFCQPPKVTTGTIAPMECQLGGKDLRLTLTLPLPHWPTSMAWAIVWKPTGNLAAQNVPQLVVFATSHPFPP